MEPEDLHGREVAIEDKLVSGNRSIENTSENLYKSEAMPLNIPVHDEEKEVDSGIDSLKSIKELLVKKTRDSIPEGTNQHGALMIEKQHPEPSPLAPTNQSVSHGKNHTRKMRQKKQKTRGKNNKSRHSRDKKESVNPGQSRIISASFQSEPWLTEGTNPCSTWPPPSCSIHPQTAPRKKQKIKEESKKASQSWCTKESVVPAKPCSMQGPQPSCFVFPSFKLPAMDCHKAAAVF